MAHLSLLHLFVHVSLEEDCTRRLAIQSVIGGLEYFNITTNIMKGSYSAPLFVSVS